MSEDRRTRSAAERRLSDAELIRQAREAHEYLDEVGAPRNIELSVVGRIMYLLESDGWFDRHPAPEEIKVSRDGEIVTPPMGGERETLPG